MRIRHGLGRPAAVLIAALMLCACARSDLSTMPSVQGVNQAAPVGADRTAAPSMTLLNARPNEDCPTRFYDCTTVSQKNGAVIRWCSGTSKKPCKTTNKYIWSGIVCLTKGATCKKPVKQLTAKMVGSVHVQTERQMQRDVRARHAYPGAWPESFHEIYLQTRDSDVRGQRLHARLQRHQRRKVTPHRESSGHSIVTPAS